TPEMLLAAKLSWLLRGFQGWNDPNRVWRGWQGQPKDVFDAHLLLTHPRPCTDLFQESLDPDLFQRSLLAVGAADDLDWTSLDALFDPPRGMEDYPPYSWQEFRQQKAALFSPGPAAMLATIAERLQPLVAGFRVHIPFLLAIKDDPADEVPYHI